VKPLCVRDADELREILRKILVVKLFQYPTNDRNLVDWALIPTKETKVKTLLTSNFSPRTA